MIHVGQVSSLLRLVAAVRLSWSNFRVAIFTALDDLLDRGRVWRNASRP